MTDQLMGAGTADALDPKSKRSVFQNRKMAELQDLLQQLGGLLRSLTE
jgi:hypothetical protein